MYSKNRIQKVFSGLSSRRTSFLVWEFFLGFTISAAVFFNTDVDLSNIERFRKFVTNSALIIIIVGLSWQSMHNPFFRKNRIFNYFFLLVKVAVIYYLVEYYGYGLNSFLYLIIPFEAYFIISEDFGVFTSLFMIIFIFFNHKFGRSLLEDISLAWTFISLNLLFLFLAMLLMRDYHNDQLKSNLLEKLQVSHQLLEEYARNVAEFTVVEERSRIAREIHDSLGHYLTAVSLQIERASIYLDRDLDEVKEALKAAKLASSEALRDVRSSVSMLREGENRFDIKIEIEKLIEGILPDYQVDYTCTGTPETYNHSVLLVLFRSLQEGLTNIQKHAEAEKITITVLFSPTTCTMIIEDDGKGFEQSSNSLKTTYGLSGMRERVELVQGELTIDSVENVGTTITIIVPSDPVLKLTESSKDD